MRSVNPGPPADSVHAGRGREVPRKKGIGPAVCLLVIVLVGTGLCRGQAILIDHEDTDITALSESAMQRAQDLLHLAYGHTSHGSQVTDGMTGLVSFANGGGKGLSLPHDFFAWNNGGTGGALDLHDYAMSGDVGYYPDWVNNTRSYLDDPSHADVNVILWSWCGQVDGKYAAGTLHSEYITPMAQLETEYPSVRFVYMTGHVDHWDDANNKAANQVIRDYCADNGKILYDFADIESYNPDGDYFEFPHDNCDYYASATGAKLGNWATEWQSTHTEDVDWYDCESAHSEPLNANQKAYAAWALFAELAGPPHKGDANDDGTVDVTDLAVLANHFASPGDMDWADGDFDDDDDVDVLDLVILANNLGWAGGGGASAGLPAEADQVPQPAAISLLALAAPALMRRRRKRAAAAERQRA